MDTKELKRTLACVSLAGLIAAGGVTLVGCASTSCSSCSGKKAEKETTQSEKGKTSCSGGEKSEGKPSGSGGTSCSGMTSCS